jgi:hypothetical protein
MSPPQSSQPDKTAARARLNIRDVARAGKFYSLAVDRFPGMPLFPGHPPFQVLTYRSPQGIRVSGAQPWGPGNDAGLGYMCEYVLSTSHSGAHIDALAHMTIGEDDHWFCGAARAHLGDFGPTAGAPRPQIAPGSSAQTSARTPCAPRRRLSGVGEKADRCAKITALRQTNRRRLRRP